MTERYQSADFMVATDARVKRFGQLLAAADDDPSVTDSWSKEDWEVIAVMHKAYLAQISEVAQLLTRCPVEGVDRVAAVRSLLETLEAGDRYLQAIGPAFAIRNM